MSCAAARPRSEDFDTFRRDVENEVRYANISIIEGIGASQHGVGTVSARIAEIILRDERVAIPIGSYSPEYGVTLSLPGIVGREGVLLTLDPELDREERQGLLRSVDTLEAALGRIRKSQLQPS